MEEPDPADPVAYAAYRRHFEPDGPEEAAGVSIEAVEDGSVRGTWFRPGGAGASPAAVLYLHGGGYTIGTAVASHAIAAPLARCAAVPTFGVDYRLAPEHPFPAAVEDALAAYEWLLASGAEGVALAGDSAGGGLALATALSLRDGGGPMPRAVVALAPWTDLTGSGDTHRTLVGWDPACAWEVNLSRSAGAYRGPHPAEHPLISPAFASYDGMPPLLIQVGTRDVLLSDAARVARAALAAGVEVTLDVWEGMWHNFQGDASLPEAAAAWAGMGRFLRTRLHPPAAGA